MFGDGYFSDVNGSPLHRGTVVSVPDLFDHQGIVGYDSWGRQVMLHNSKRRGRTAATTPAEFSEGHRIGIIYVPQTDAEGIQLEQTAWGMVRLGTTWTVFDNCQDFVSRVRTGKNGSKTRNVILGGLAALALLAWAS